MNFQKVKIGNLKPAAYNPRKDLQPSDKEYKKIKKSVQEFGYVDPIIVNQDLTVIGGHQRIKVLKELGYEDIECVIVDIDKNKEKALNIALNKISGDWDFEALNEAFIELMETDVDLLLTGFDDIEIQRLMNEFNTDGSQEDNFDVEGEFSAIETPVTKRGDIWGLGDHRVMCGDSTDLTEVKKLMGGKKANLTVTDPPYNVDYTGGTKDALKMQNDKMDGSSFYDFLYKAYTNAYEVSEDGAGIYLFHADSEGLNVRKAMVDAKWKMAQCCIWVKQAMVMGRQDYQWQHEPVLYGWKPTCGHKWYSDRKQTTIWNFDRPTKSKSHPTMKPIKLISYPIKNSSSANSIILDLFGGSGSTLVACDPLDRICYMMELDEKYCDVIIKRWEQLTGKKGEKLNA